MLFQRSISLSHRTQRQNCFIVGKSRRGWGRTVVPARLDRSWYQMNQGRSARTHTRGEHYKQADRGVFKSSGLFLSVRSLSVSHGGANGFYFQDTMLLQCLGLLWRRRGRERGSNIWSAHGDVVILNSLARHTEGIRVEGGGEREREPERKERVRRGGRGTEGGRKGRSEGARGGKKREG